MPDAFFKEKESHIGRLILPLLLALLLRTAWAATIEAVPISDSHAYDSFARNIVEFGVYGWTANEPFAFWPPGTSFIYATVYKLFGFNFHYLVVLNIVLSCALILTTARVAARFFGSAVGIIAAYVLAIWPTMIMFTTILASELPFIFLSVLALDSWSSRSLQPRMRGLVSGFCLGAAALVRPLALALPFVYGLALSFGHDALFRSRVLMQVKIGTICLIVMACLISPWTYRNYQLYKALVLVSTNGGTTLWMGNSPGTEGGYRDIPDRLSGLSDYQQSKLLGDEAKRYIFEDFSGFLLRSARKAVQLFNNESIGVYWNVSGIQNRFGENGVVVLKRITQISWALILLFCGLGFLDLMFSRKDALLSPFSISVVFYTLVHSIIVSQDRYHLEFAPQIATFAALGLICFYRSTKAVRVRLLSHASEKPLG